MYGAPKSLAIQKSESLVKPEAAYFKLFTYFSWFSQKTYVLVTDLYYLQAKFLFLKALELVAL